MKKLGELYLHLNVQNPPRLIPCFDVQYGQLVVGEVLVVKRIQDLDANNRIG